MLAKALTVLSLSFGVLAAPTVLQSRSPSSISDLALQKVLSDASPVFGYYTTKNTKYSTWMSKYSDSTQLIHLNIPGAHDPQTWNYSQATQEALKHVTDLDGNPPLPAEVYRCQEKSFIDMLSAGIRVFDIRYAFDVTNSTLVYWHSQGLLSETATVEDTLFGFYTWLDAHPTETLMLSFQYEGSTTLYGTNDANVQLQLFNLLTSAAAKKYFLQTSNAFGTLGEARGKITLLKRFDMDQLPASYSNLPGVHFSPSLWTDDDPDITLVYDTVRNATAYIEDYYETDVGNGASAAYNIALKYNATTSHLLKAANPTYRDSLFWSFASSENDVNTPIDTPKIMAVGNGTYTPLGGVNQQLVPFFRRMKGKRLGIVMFDFFDTPGELVESFLDVSPA
ncbi:1-phosphatidylinositol phosphodiesterase [Hyphodiscus hymeniophilus]|uniref:1-phosphatidylinositol phosphodiesterase n=1 Tax=Hyphodiscus hymeniophilus TaxID=353542 RepID=A0A9P6VPS5_9HELO|nr:1-phosphatidylinositol phosphodiesterase [Hyphodiscus hymeniophilus]